VVSSVLLISTRREGAAYAEAVLTTTLVLSRSRVSQFESFDHEFKELIPTLKAKIASESSEIVKESLS